MRQDIVDWRMVLHAGLARYKLPRWVDGEQRAKIVAPYRWAVESACAKSLCPGRRPPLAREARHEAAQLFALVR